MNTPGYESLAAVLQRAYDQAAKGKGAERHAVSRPFTEQPMQSISGLLGSPDGLLYQAMKKVQESKRLDKDAGVRELLGAVNYLAGAIIFIEAGSERPVLDAASQRAKDLLHAVARFPVGSAKQDTGMGNWTCTGQGSHDPVLAFHGHCCPRCFSLQP